MMAMVSTLLGRAGYRKRLIKTIIQHKKMEFIMRTFKIILLLVSVISWAAFSNHAAAGIKANYWAFWDKSDEANQRIIDHAQFDMLLQSYVLPDHQSGINRFRYGDIKRADRKQLNRYIKKLSRLDPTEYSRREQKAYWLNLYNALTIREVLRLYPIDTMPIAQFKDRQLVSINRTKLSLNDIQNRILRPIWQDRKVLFGLSCATLGCPNIQAEAFTGSNSKALLRKSTREFINHPRGLVLHKQQMKASKLFDWYSDDFGSDKNMIKFLAHYADDRKALYLLGFQGQINYAFDTRLNSPDVDWSN
jgi:hypothetical protein